MNSRVILRLLGSTALLATSLMTSGGATTSPKLLTPCDEAAKSPRLSEIEARLVRVRALAGLRLNPTSPGELVRDYEYGSGVVIGDGKVVTSYHTVKGWTDVPPSDREISILLSTGKSYSPVALIAADPAKDIAILQANPWTASSSSSSCVARKPEDARPGSVVWTAGFPAAADPMRFEIGLIRGVLLERDARITQLRGEGRRSFRWIAVSQQIPPGFSGGAVLDDRGGLLGVLLGAPIAAGRWQEFSYGISVSELGQIGRSKHESP